MEKAKRARKAETPKQPSLSLRLRAPYFYPDHSAFDVAGTGDVSTVEGAADKAESLAGCKSLHRQLPVSGG